MEFRIFPVRDYYETLSAWWVAQKWPAVAEDHLPERGFGVFIGERLACAGFLYVNGSALANFEWIVADPDVRREERTAALNALILGTKDLARLAGVKSVFTSTRHSTLISRLEKNGFQQTDQNMTNLLGRT